MRQRSDDLSLANSTVLLYLAISELDDTNLHQLAAELLADELFDELALEYKYNGRSL